MGKALNLNKYTVVRYHVMTNTMSNVVARHLSLDDAQDMVHQMNTVMRLLRRVTEYRRTWADRHGVSIHRANMECAYSYAVRELMF